MYRAQWINSCARILFLLASSLALLAAQVPPRAAKQQIPPEPAGTFDLEVAKQYEKQSRWKEAEQEYLQAGRIGAPGVRKEALAAIERLATHRPSDEENFESELAKSYEDKEDWKDAEQHYSASGKEAPKSIRDAALKNVSRVHEHFWFQEKVDDFDRWAGYTARVLALAYLIVLISRVHRMRKGIQVMPFDVSSDDASKRLIFALSSAREELPALLSPVLTTMAANVVDAPPLIMLPGVENEFPDPAEDLELAEVKVPIASWIRFFNRSAIRVSGRWQVGQTAGIVQARILRRIFPMAYKQSRLASARVDAMASDQQNRQLLLFGYDVLVKAIFARRYGP